MAKKKRKEPMNNNEKVLANGISGKAYPYTLGDLKRAFMSKTLPEEIKSVFCKRQNQLYFISYKYTKGFIYKKLAGDANG